MKKLILAAVASLVMGTAAPADPIKIGNENGQYPPFSSQDSSGKWVGWEIDLINAICAQAKLECVLTPTSWDGIIPALTSGQIDVIMASMSITPERQKIIDFSDKYYAAPTMVAVAKDSSITPDEAGLTGKVIGAQVSTVNEQYVQTHFAAGAAEVKTYQTEDEAYQDLAAGRLDAVIANAIQLQAFLDSGTGRECCKSAGLVAPDPEVLGLGVGLGVRKGDPLKQPLNAAIKAIRADGTYDAITKKYFNFNIYGD
ncbi:transporter substrate-binding domain-containing protein [Phyllobacterium endophyticum]|uniref:Amino acid ABC transporter n=1 Tax=Phyllobacterium endophyticum TaxID=1149773 RepID=A0A2P7AKD6_9HYPH|nr:transporter substrate-binding domain-containing protein [Phyllobacterium endophyticum]MBB3237104.1 polar amino acid transport system substrate-binding protein [Phyllobacterium endophyticum]PSH54660.1 amino acid ABC transporter [Phyllobacterium endophyticum]TYR40572.1 transporter substrate-binding domain-containing protein [Phyllobacterium endophyticum]